MLAGLLAKAKHVFDMVPSGRGMEYCCSIEGLSVNYYGMFTVICSVIVAVLVGAATLIHRALSLMFLRRRQVRRRVL